MDAELQPLRMDPIAQAREPGVLAINRALTVNAGVLLRAGGRWETPGYRDITAERIELVPKLFRMGPRLGVGEKPAFIDDCVGPAVRSKARSQSKTFSRN